ncbi:alpha-amylase family glycosyl hydrolase [Pseudonocardia nigra]|uniref:alpha-amylase family glycosyl hydrolase n=1 Tax=Pseudonocardia nigra TaxID=1921578 RepID=UPI001C5D38E0|nr:alpha-amylase family glycosyl hydrolase [Pseudonocardia nigra]
MPELTTATEPDWVEHAIWWHVYPLGFVGAEPAADGHPTAHRLQRIVDWLDYAVELGASGLALGPVFASETHGYDTVDHYRIDPRLGDADDFAALLDAAHARGLRVLLDGVFNHVGRGFRAPDESWYRRVDGDYATFEGHGGLVALDHDEPAVADHVVDVMCHWLAAGADGWRLDAAYAVPPEFWARVLPRVLAAHPDAYVVGEVIHGDYAATVRDSGMHAVTQYELWKAIWSSINDGNFYELAWALERHDELLDTFVPLTFVGNHDVTRIASAITDDRHLPHALAVLFTVAGTPSVYYGDEQAFRGVKEHRAGGDDAVRPAFPADRAELAPFGWPTYHVHQELIGLRRRHPWLHRARTRQLQLTNTALVLEASEGEHRLVVALNIGDDPLDHDGPGEVLAGHADVRDGGVTVPPHEWAVLG